MYYQIWLLGICEAVNISYLRCMVVTLAGEKIERGQAEAGDHLVIRADIVASATDITTSLLVLSELSCSCTRQPTTHRSHLRYLCSSHSLLYVASRC